MRVTNFPECCGATIISDFGFTRNRTSSTIDPKLAEVKEFLRSRDVLARPLTVVILNEDQYRALNRTFVEAGFEVTMTAPSNHKGDLYLYARNNYAKGVS